MTKDEALKLALEALEAAYARLVTKCEQNLVTYNGVDVDTLTLSQEAITAIKEALMSVPDGAQPEPVKIAHKHEWFRTGEMKVGQMRCISCGTWGQEEMPQRTWVGLTEDEAFACQGRDYFETYKAIEAKLKERNT